MENNNFRKRLKDLKVAAFKKIQEIDLDNSGTKAGYYSIKSMQIVLSDLIDKYDIDYDIVNDEEYIFFTWFDCLSDAIRTIKIRIPDNVRNCGKLSLMKNEVQSWGAVLTYSRRYIMTVALNLNATDLIENNTGNKATIKTFIDEKTIETIKNKFDKDVINYALSKSNYKNLSSIPADKKNELVAALNSIQLKKNAKKEEPKEETISKEEVEKVLKTNEEARKIVLSKNKIHNVFLIKKTQLNDILKQIADKEKELKNKPTMAQIKRLYTLATNANVSNEEMKKLLYSKFKINSSKELSIKQYDNICTDLENMIKNSSKNNNNLSDKYNNIPNSLPV